MLLIVNLFKSFMLIGVGAYGGGLVTIPLIQHEIVTVQKWLSFEEMASLLAIAQMTPGPIAINAATFIGFQTAGLYGSLAATVGVILPSLVLLAFAAPFMDRISLNEHVRMVRKGFQLGVLSLIIFAAWSYNSAAVAGWVDFIFAGAAFAALVVFERRLHPIVVILACGLAGLFVF